MSNDISVFGSRIQLVASQTFPNGITLTQFADDADPFDSPSIQVRDKAMGVNGDLIAWSKATPLPLTLNMVPNSDDDINLGVLLDANRVGRGKLGAQDDISITVLYPDGASISFTGGMITDGSIANSGASSGRFKSKPYAFAFENVNRNQG